MPNFGINKAAQKVDLIDGVCSRADAISLAAMQRGWNGPPFDPQELAAHLGIRVIAKGDVVDARIVPLQGGNFQIEFNPNKPSARVRFSVAHEIAHTLFPECALRIQNRLNRREMTPSDIQTEMLCNVAAGCFLMPIGSFSELGKIPVTLERMIKTRRDFDVSMEAVLLRLVRLTETPCIVFASSFKANGIQGAYCLDYSVSSRTCGASLTRGMSLSSSLVKSCIAIGYVASGEEQWLETIGMMRIECVGISPFPGSKHPRVIGIIFPQQDQTKRPCGISIITGDATEPVGKGPRIVAHVVNDKTPNWGAGFGLAIRKRWPLAQDSFRRWWNSAGVQAGLGEVYSTSVTTDISIFQLICQHGYGPSPTTRLKYSALKDCLEKLVAFAKVQDASIHMPRIGTGESGGSWALVQQLIDEVVCARGVPVTVYDWPLHRTDKAEMQPQLFDRRPDR